MAEQDTGIVEKATNCRICLVGCGTRVRIGTDGTILSVRGDDDHPKSKGYMCPKGPQLLWHQQRPDRLDYPLLGGKRASWDTALDDLARKIEKAIAAHGPDAFGIYTGTGTDAPVANTFLGRLLTALGSNQLYTPLTLDIAPTLKAQELVTGQAGALTPFWDHDDEAVRLVIVFGSNPAVSHGYSGAGVMTDTGRLYRDFRARGGRIWTVDPVRTRSAALSDGHIAAVPGTDPVILCWLVRQALERLPADSPVMAKTRGEDRDRLRAAIAPFDLATVARISDVPAEQLRALDDDIVNAGRIVFPSGTGLSFGPHGLVGEWLRWALLILTDSLEEPGGMWIDAGWAFPLETRTDWVAAPEDGGDAPAPASRPDMRRLFGQTPCAAMADEILSGPLRTLLVLGGNPVTAMPQPDRTRKAFAALDALGVVDIVESPLTALASHVLPATGQLERMDLWGLLVPPVRPLLSMPLIAPVAERRHSWEIACGLARRLGVLDAVAGGLDFETASQEDVIRSLIPAARHTFEELVAAGPHGVTCPRPFRWALERAVPDGKWRLAPKVLVDRLPGLMAKNSNPAFPLHLISGRQDRRYNSAENPRTPKKADHPLVRICPEDAARFGIAHGKPARLTSAYGSVTVNAVVEETIRRGAVQMPHGFEDANVAHLNSPVDVDPLTTQPQMTAFEVAIEPALAEA